MNRIYHSLSNLLWWSKWQEAILSRQAAYWKKPNHLGLILDGNRRYAQKWGLASHFDGHTMGADKLEEVLEWCRMLGIHTVSVWIFSIENFQRDQREVSKLMDLFEKKLNQLLNGRQLHQTQTRIRALGRLDMLPQRVQEQLQALSTSTAHHQQNILNIGVSYSGREEIVDSVRSWLRIAHQQGLTLEDAAEHFSEHTIAAHLYTAGLSEPDLIIRTSGEIRHSGFLLWQAAYAEYYFSPTYWPLFRKLDLLKALQAYHHRKRRYGL